MDSTTAFEIKTWIVMQPEISRDTITRRMASHLKVPMLGKFEHLRSEYAVFQTPRADRRVTLNKVHCSVKMINVHFLSL